MKLSRSDLEALAQVTLACSADRSRPILCAVELTITASTLTAWATDSYIAACRTIELDGQGPTSDVVVLIDGKVLAGAVKAALGASRYVFTFEVECSAEGMTIHHASGTSKAHATVGRFPDIRRFVAEHKATTAEVTALDPAKLLQVGRALGYAPKKGQSGHGVILEHGASGRGTLLTLVGETDKTRNLGLIMPIRIR